MTKDNHNYVGKEVENALKYMKSSSNDEQCKKTAKSPDVGEELLELQMFGQKSRG